MDGAAGWRCPTSVGTALRASPPILGGCVLSICSRVARGRASSGRVVPATNPGAKAKANTTTTTTSLAGSVQDSSSVGRRVSVLVGTWKLPRFITAKARCSWICLPPSQQRQQPRRKERIGRRTGGKGR